MCRESLKHYLADAARTSLDALKRVKVCDPACGSGAYLLGMRQELLRLRESLFAAKARDHERIYDRKLDIIQRNLYGVDKDEFAVNIVMLRLWLSLVVDDERDPLDDESVDVSLPNLKFKGAGRRLAHRARARPLAHGVAA